MRFNAPMLIYCSNCRKFNISPEDSEFLGECPVCNSTPRTMKCTRCGGEWTIRTPKLPNTCPKCKSPYWNRQRVQG